MTELKPCPFCNGDASIGQSIVGGRWLYHVECLNCGSMAQSCGPYQKAIDVWNQRAKSPEYQKLLAFVKEVAECKWMQTVEIRLAKELFKEIGEEV